MDPLLCDRDDRGVVTLTLNRPARKNALDLSVRDEIAAGRQAFIVCPLIDPSDVLGIASVTDDDGISDGDEINVTLSLPLDCDSDNDGLVDGLEAGLTSVGMVVRCRLPGVVVGMAGPSARLTPERAESLVPRLRRRGSPQ